MSLRIFTRIRFLLILAASLMAGSPAFAVRFAWPDSIQHPRVIMNATQSLNEYMEEHPDWFAKDFVAISLFITGGEPGSLEQLEKKFNHMRDKLWYNHMAFGSYVSGTTVMFGSEMTTFPARTVPIEIMPPTTHYLGPWLREPEQKVVDLSHVESRLALEGWITQLWNSQHQVLRFIDNAAVHSRVAANMQSWDNYCINIKTLRYISETRFSGPAVFNVFARAWELSEAETAQLIDAVAGPGNNAISFPLPWSRAIKDDKTANGWAIYRYRQMLDKGIVLILIPSDDATDSELFGWIATWRRPGDRIFIATPFWQEPPV